MCKYLSGHNVSDLESVVYELKEMSYALSLLTHLNDKDVNGHEVEWRQLVNDVSDLIGQHVTSLDICFDCICRGKDFNID